MSKILSEGRLTADERTHEESKKFFEVQNNRKKFLKLNLRLNFFEWEFFSHFYLPTTENYKNETMK